MNPFILMAGVLLAVASFAAMIFSVARAVQERGWLRRAHLGVIIGTIASMASISLVSPGLALISGGALLLSGLGAAFLETGWNRLLPLIAAGFGLVIAAGLPFA